MPAFLHDGACIAILHFFEGVCLTAVILAFARGWGGSVWGCLTPYPRTAPVCPGLRRSPPVVFRDEFQKSQFDRQAADFSLLDHPGRDSKHLSCLNSRHLSCLSSRHLSCLNSRHLSCLNRRHLSCLNRRHNSCRPAACSRPVFC